MASSEDDRGRDYPPAPCGWFSGSGLQSAGYKQGSATINRKLLELRNTLIEDVVATGIRRDVAAEIIESHLIGTKTPLRGRAAIHASPEAISLLERAGLLTHKWDHALVDRDSDKDDRGFSR